MRLCGCRSSSKDGSDVQQQLLQGRRSQARKLQVGEKANRAMFQTVEINSYLRDNMDSVIQEGRWRAVLSKDLASRHRRLMSKIEHTDRSLGQLTAVLRPTPKRGGGPVDQRPGKSGAMRSAMMASTLLIANSDGPPAPAPVQGEPDEPALPLAQPEQQHLPTQQSSQQSPEQPPQQPPTPTSDSAPPTRAVSFAPPRPHQLARRGTSALPPIPGSIARLMAQRDAESKE